MDPIVDEFRARGLGYFAQCPDCLISMMLFYLDVEDVIRLSATSKLMRVFCSEEPLWMHLALKYQGKDTRYLANWRQTALSAYQTAYANGFTSLVQSATIGRSDLLNDVTAPFKSKQVSNEAIEAAAKPLSPVQGFYSLFLYRRWYRCHVDLSACIPEVEAVRKVDVAVMTATTFLEEYDMACRPIVIKGLMADWPAKHWTLESLSKRFPDQKFRASKPHGGGIYMTLGDYADYMRRQHDEEPLYIFDAEFGSTAPALVKDYRVPGVFGQDFFEILGASRRPSFRWLVVGPCRSGASWHVDPSLTSAWNALVSGRKRWALYPPDVVPPGVRLENVKERRRRGQDGKRKSKDDRRRVGGGGLSSSSRTGKSLSLTTSRRKARGAISRDRQQRLPRGATPISSSALNSGGDAIFMCPMCPSNANQSNSRKAGEENTEFWARRETYDVAVPEEMTEAASGSDCASDSNSGDGDRDGDDGGDDDNDGDSDDDDSDSDAFVDHNENLSSLQWFLEVYPMLLPDQKPLEFIQEPGETVFVPGGWWHMVLNLEDSVAVTQNFVSEANAERVVSYLAGGSAAYYDACRRGTAATCDSAATLDGQSGAAGAEHPNRPSASSFQFQEKAGSVDDRRRMYYRRQEIATWEEMESENVGVWRARVLGYSGRASDLSSDSDKARVSENLGIKEAGEASSFSRLGSGASTISRASTFQENDDTGDDADGVDRKAKEEERSNVPCAKRRAEAADGGDNGAESLYELFGKEAFEERDACPSLSVLKEGASRQVRTDVEVGSNAQAEPDTATTPLQVKSVKEQEEVPSSTSVEDEGKLCPVARLHEPIAEQEDLDHAFGSAGERMQPLPLPGEKSSTQVKLSRLDPIRLLRQLREGDEDTVPERSGKKPRLGDLPEEKEAPAAKNKDCAHRSTAAAAAAASLRGLRRERVLGEWLRALWIHVSTFSGGVPNLRLLAWRCICRSLPVQLWHRILTQISERMATEHGGGRIRISQPRSPLDLVPICGMDAAVFFTADGEHVVKFFMHKSSDICRYMEAMEVLAPFASLASAAELDSKAVGISRIPPPVALGKVVLWDADTDKDMDTDEKAIAGASSETSTGAATADAHGAPRAEPRKSLSLGGGHPARSDDDDSTKLRLAGKCGLPPKIEKGVRRKDGDESHCNSSIRKRRRGGASRKPPFADEDPGSPLRFVVLRRIGNEGNLRSVRQLDGESVGQFATSSQGGQSRAACPTPHVLRPWSEVYKRRRCALKVGDSPPRHPEVPSAADVATDEAAPQGSREAVHLDDGSPFGRSTDGRTLRCPDAARLAAELGLQLGCFHAATFQFFANPSLRNDVPSSPSSHEGGAGGPSAIAEAAAVAAAAALPVCFKDREDSMWISLPESPSAMPVPIPAAAELAGHPYGQDGWSQHQRRERGPVPCASYLENLKDAAGKVHGAREGRPRDPAPPIVSPATSPFEDSGFETPYSGCLSSPCAVSPNNPWWPFVQFLRKRRGNLRDILEAADVPAWFLRSADRLIPLDPAALLFWPAGSDVGSSVPISTRRDAPTAATVPLRSVPRPPPTLLHGDLNQDNVWVSLCEDCSSCAARLLDFSDGGHGDPLWDVVLAAGACLRFNPSALRIFWKSYRRRVSLLEQWVLAPSPPPPPPPANSLSNNASNSIPNTASTASTASTVTTTTTAAAAASFPVQFGQIWTGGARPLPLSLPLRAMAYCVLDEEQAFLRAVSQGLIDVGALVKEGLSLARAEGNRRPGEQGAEEDGDQRTEVENENFGALALAIWGFLDEDGGADEDEDGMAGKE